MNVISYIVVFSLLSSSLVISQTRPESEEVQAGMTLLTDLQWKQTEGAINEKVELVNRNHNLSVTMWKENNSTSSGEFLQELLSREGIVATDKPFNTIVDNRNALAVRGICNEMHRPIQVVIIAVKQNEDFYVIKFKCPEECFAEHKKNLKSLIGSVRLGIES